MSLGENIRMYRKALKLTQGELADKIGLQAAAVSKIERGATQNVAPEQLNILCKLFHCTPTDLYGVSSVMVTSPAPLTTAQQQLIALVSLMDDEKVNLLLDVAKAMSNADL